MNPNYSKHYKKAISELQQEQYTKRLYEIRKEEERMGEFYYPNKVLRYGRIITLTATIGLCTIIGLAKSCDGKDKGYNPKIEHLEDKIRGK